MLPILNLGHLAINTPGLVLMAGLWISLELASREAKRRGFNVDRYFYLGFNLVVAGIIGARLGFVVTHPNIYLDITPILRLLLSIVSPTPGTEIGWLGFLSALGAGWYFIRKWDLPFLETLDIYAPSLALMSFFTGIAHLASGEMYGTEATLPWGVFLWGAERHPTQLYLAVLGLLLFIYLWRAGPEESGSKRQKSKEIHVLKTQPDGTFFQILLIGMGLSLLIIEAFRADSPVILNGLRVWQIIALLMTLAGLSGFAYRAPLTEAPE